MHKRLYSGFTIVEIAIVVIVIAILATLIVVSYNGVTRNAVETSMKADLKNAATEVGLYRIDNNGFPDTADDLALDASEDNQLTYVRLSDGYCMAVTSDKLQGVSFRVTKEDNNPQEGDCYTPEDCYYSTLSSGSVTITGSVYSCGQSHVIPKSIGGNPVTSIINFGPAKSVVIPNSVSTIGANAFQTNYLEYISIPSSVTSIGERAFFGNSLKSVKIPSSITKIDKGVFRANKLKSIDIPNSVVEIDEEAFSVNELEKVRIPSSVVTIGPQAFAFNTGIECSIPTGKSFPGIGCDSVVYY